MAKCMHIKKWYLFQIGLYTSDTTCLGWYFFLQELIFFDLVLASAWIIELLWQLYPIANFNGCLNDFGRVRVVIIDH